MVPKSHDDNIRWPQNGQIMSARAGMERKKLAAAECEIGVSNRENIKILTFHYP